MSAPTTAETLTGLANAAGSRYLNREVERAVSLTGHPTRPLTKTELAKAVAILLEQGCVPSEICMRLDMTRGEFDRWWCSGCEKWISIPGHTCVGVQS